MRRTALPAVLLALVAVSAAALPPAQNDAVESLIEALTSDPSPRVRAQAALALKPRAAEAVPVLVQALRDDAAVVRAAAARALADAAPERVFPDLVVASRDEDTLVARWARTAACRLLGRADRVRFDVRRMAAHVAAPADWSDKVFQEKVLTALLTSNRFDVTKALDFSDEAPPEDLVVKDWSKGPVFADPVPATPERAPVGAALRGYADVVDRTSEGVKVHAELLLEAMNGTLLWRGVATAWGRPRAERAADLLPGTDTEAGDLAALRTAARTVSRLLLGALSPGAGTAPGNGSEDHRVGRP